MSMGVHRKEKKLKKVINSILDQWGYKEKWKIKKKGVNYINGGTQEIENLKNWVNVYYINGGTQEFEKIENLSRFILYQRG